MKNNNLVHLLYAGQGGLGSYFRSFVESDSDSLFKHYAYWYGNVDLYKEYADFCILNNIPFIYKRKKLKLDLFSWLHCANWIKKTIPDGGVVCIHTLSLTPVIYFLNDKYKIIAIDHSSYAIKTKLDWWFSKYIHNHHTLIYFYTEQVEQLKKKFGKAILNKKVYFISKTVNINSFKPSNDKMQNKNLVLGMASRINKGKRYDLLLSLAEYFKDKAVEATIQIAGEGPMLSYWQNQTKERGLENFITFVGLLNQQQLISFYQSLDIYVHATDGETICYSIMEAQACALPILASDVEGVNNAIVSGKEGYLFDNSVDGIINSFHQLLYNSNRIQISNFNRAISESRYNQFNNPKLLIEILSHSN